MTSGLYSTFAGLAARSRALELVANNLANVNTTGYKAQREFYRSFTAQLNRARLSPLNRAINNFGVLGGSVVDRSSGTLEPTGNDLDLALEGPGFFTIQTAAGVRYTRNGNFRMSPTGELVTEKGDRVLARQEPGQPPAPIQIPNGQVSVSPDGTVSVQGAVVARLRLADFAPEIMLTPEGNSYFVAPAGSEQPAADASVRQGALEASNLNVVEGAVGLIILQRHAGILQRALSLFHNEFNRIAVEDLPRI